MTSMPNFFLCGGRFPSSTTLVFDPVPALASGVQFCDLFFAPRARAHVLVPFCTCVMHPTSQVRLWGLQTRALTSVLPGTFDSPYPSHLSFSPLTSLSVGFLSLSPFSFSFFIFFWCGQFINLFSVSLFKFWALFPFPFLFHLFTLLPHWVFSCNFLF